MARGTRSTRQSSRSRDHGGNLIDPLRENGYDDLFAQQRALLAAVDAVRTPNSPAVGRGLGDRFSITSENVDAAVAAAGLFRSPTPAALHSGYGDPYVLDRFSEPASVRRRSRSATPAQRRVPVGPTPTLPAQSLFVARGNGDFFDLPADYFDSSPPRARSVSAVAGGEPSPRYTPVSPAYDPTDDFLDFNPPRSPARDAVARRLDGITETLERLHRRVDWRSDRIDAQLMVVVDALRNQRNEAAATATPNNRKRKRSADGRDVVDLTGVTPSPKKVDFVDLVTDSSWSGSRFSSDSSSSSSDSLSSSSSSDDDDDEDDKQSTPSKKPKPPPNRSPSSPRSPRTPPNNRTQSPPRTPRKEPPRRPFPRTPPRQRAPSVPSIPPAPRKARAASRSLAPQAPRTSPQHTAPARPATPPAPRRTARVPKPTRQEDRIPAPSRVTTRDHAAAKKAAPKPRPNPTTYVRRRRT
ncbi:hypothetical protein MBLNU13_g02404t1 [Cladosporium sp. NU13]